MHMRIIVVSDLSGTDLYSLRHLIRSLVKTAGSPIAGADRELDYVFAWRNVFVRDLPPQL